MLLRKKVVCFWGYVPGMTILLKDTPLSITCTFLKTPFRPCRVSVLFEGGMNFSALGRQTDEGIFFSLLSWNSTFYVNGWIPFS